MRVLITGASGFLGQRTVRAFLERGHTVRAMARPASRVEAWASAPRLELFRADLRVATNLSDAFRDVDVLVHLAAAVLASDATHYAVTVGGTERLLDAMARSRTRRVVLASSLSVYDWAAAHGSLTEDSPLESRPYARGAYATAKLWQERVATELSRQHGWSLSVLRPGVIWGPGHDALEFVGPRVGRLLFVLGPRRRLPLTYVENCANCFVAAAESDTPDGSFNIIDSAVVRAWSYAGAWTRGSGRRAVRIPLPFWLAWVAAHAASITSRWLFGDRGKLPSLLMPRRLAVFKPLRFSNLKATSGLGWRPRVGFEDAISRAAGGAGG